MVRHDTCVIIPLNSGLVFVLLDDPTKSMTDRLNPFEFRAGICSLANMPLEFIGSVLIPLNSGLVFVHLRLVT